MYILLDMDYSVILAFVKNVKHQGQYVYSACENMEENTTSSGPLWFSIISRLILHSAKDRQGWTQIIRKLLFTILLREVTTKGELFIKNINEME